jgi:hypothetical protein
LSTEFKTSAFRDARLSARLGTIADAAAESPDKGFPIQARSDAALEGTYRFLGNSKVTPQGILDPHYACTVRRASESASVILAVHDSTEFEFDPESVRDELGWLTTTKRGFLGHFCLGVSADGLRRPFGVLGMTTIFRSAFPEAKAADKAEKKKTKKNKGRGNDLNGESRRWSDLALEVSGRLAGTVAVIHVMDREGDSYALLGSLLDAHQRFVIRVNHDRVVIDDGLPNGKDRLYTVLNRPNGQIERKVKISKRKQGKGPAKALKEHPDREERTATLLFSATQATLKRPKDRSSKLPATLTLNFVHVWEPDPPAGQDPVEWRLVTTEPVGTVEEIVAVVDWYRARWLIEEFFKALKTGCAYEKRQLESRSAMLNTLALFGPVAWRLLVLRDLARNHSDAPATEALTDVQIKVLGAVVKRLKLNVKLSKEPTVGQAMLAIAALGGHIKYNGQPGWQVLGRGFDKLLTAELGWWAFAEQG